MIKIIKKIIIVMRKNPVVSVNRADSIHVTEMKEYVFTIKNVRHEAADKGMAFKHNMRNRSLVFTFYMYII